jgi:hypothetical protein
MHFQYGESRNPTIEFPNLTGTTLCPHIQQFPGDHAWLAKLSTSRHLCHPNRAASVARQQMFVSECPSGSAFQATFKSASGHFVLKRSIEHQFPRREFPGVSRMAAIYVRLDNDANHE